MPPFAVIKLKLEAVVDDGAIVFDDVVQYVSSWALNSIPVASLLVAVGKRVDTDKQATIHESLDSLRQHQKIEIFLTPTLLTVEKADPALPDQVRMKIFEGKIVGTGWRRTTTGAHFTINILHWLGDVNYTSAISASSHPGNPADYVYPAVFRGLGPGSSVSAGGNPTWVPMVEQTLVNNFEEDLWTNTLKPMMQQIAEDDPFEVALIGGQPGGGDENTLAALDRMKVDPVAPLEVNLFGTNASVIQHSLAQALILETKSNWVNTTLWGKLIGDFSPAYWFSVVPRVEDALIVPYTGGLQGEPWAVIGSEDYNQSDLNAQLHQVLRAVGIVHPVMMMTGFDANRGMVKVDHGGCAGWYQPKDQEKGMVLLKDAPRWLSDAVVPFVFSSKSQGVDMTPIGTVLDEEGTGGPRDPDFDIEKNQESFKEVLSAYAHQWYVLESLKGRVGEISGKLRFDICPGSNIKVEAGGSRNVDEDAGLTEDIFATVMQVSYLINAESQRAGTAFTLDHIRTARENTEDSTSVPGPPLYTKKWVGNVLSEHVAPETI